MKGGVFEDDPSVLCTNQREEPCCKITVSLSKEAANAVGFCAAVYKRTNLLSMGREVVTVSQPSFVNLFCRCLNKLEGTITSMCGQASPFGR